MKVAFSLFVTQPIFSLVVTYQNKQFDRLQEHRDTMGGRILLLLVHIYPIMAFYSFSGPLHPTSFGHHGLQPLYAKKSSAQTRARNATVSKEERLNIFFFLCLLCLTPLVLNIPLLMLAEIPFPEQFRHMQVYYIQHMLLSMYEGRFLY